MKRRFRIESVASGVIFLTYSNYMLNGIEFDQPDWTQEQILEFLKSIPLTYQKLNELSIKAITAKKWTSIVEVTENVNFEAFWAKYPRKEGKKKAETNWNHLTEIAKRQAIYFLPNYLKQKAETKEAIHHAKTYLSQRIWEDFSS